MTRKPRRTKKANLVLPLILVLLLLTGSLLTSPSSGLSKASALNYQEIFGLIELDGNLTDSNDPGFDWNTLNRIPISSNVPPLIAHTGLIRDPAPTSVFTTAASRDNNDISEWRHSTGAVQDRGDISNAYAAAFRALNNDLIFVVGADRLESGDGAIGFWFLQNRVVAAADGTFRTGPSSTDPLATHAIGDLLVVVEFRGSFAASKVYMWVGSNGDQVGGTLQDVTASLRSAEAVGSVIPQKAPWLYVPRKGPVGIIPAGAFFEGAVNVSEAVPGANFLCTPTVLVETRSSLSLGAPLQDFVLTSFRPVVSVPSATICEATPTTLPVSLSEGTPPYSLSATSTGGLNLRGITIGATTPGGAPGTYQITTTATDVNGCIGSSTATLTILPKPVCNLSVPDPLPVCNSQNNSLSGPSGFASYSWSVSSANNDWTITGGTNSQTITYTAGSGPATFKLVVNGSNSCQGTCEVNVTCR